MDQRPTSPHLTIYRLPLTAKMSISHRITGVALMGGSALLVAWLFVAAYQPGQYSGMHELMSSWVGRILLVGWTLAFYFHLANGIRHLFWDMGKGFSLPQTARANIIVLLFTVIMTGASWCPVLLGYSH